MKYRELPAIREKTADFDEIESEIKRVLRELIYRPLFEILEERMKNSRITALQKAILQGRVTYHGGAFRGRLSAEITRELKDLGATWDPEAGIFLLAPEALPAFVTRSIYQGAYRFKKKLESIDKKLQQNLPAELAGKLELSALFDKAIFNVDRDITRTLEDLQILPAISAEERKRIADEWETSARLSIKGFATEEIASLRKEIYAAARAGNRYETLIKKIQKSYGVSARKAKFLARQETGLLMAKFKEVRYTSAGVTHYIWGCVAGTPAHPVRPSHKVLEDKMYSWNDPPITTAANEPARRNNPGQDFNCRCFARPVVKF